MSDKLSRRGAGAQSKAVVPDLPDSDTTVLMWLPDDEAMPLWPGFHDGECWRYAHAGRVLCHVAGWMHFDEAAAMLFDVRRRPEKKARKTSAASAAQRETQPRRAKS